MEGLRGASREGRRGKYIEGRVFCDWRARVWLRGLSGEKGTLFKGEGSLLKGEFCGVERSELEQKSEWNEWWGLRAGGRGIFH